MSSILMADIAIGKLSFWGLEIMVSHRQVAPQCHIDDVWGCNTRAHGAKGRLAENLYQW